MKKFFRFQQITAEAFRFLITSYGFEHVSTEISSDWEGYNQCEVVFSNFPVQVHVTYILNGKFVGCYFDLYQRTTDGRWKGYDVIDLSFLIQIRCPEKEVEQEYEQNTKQDVDRIVRTYAEIIKTYGSDILKGDFRILPEVKRVVEDEHKRNVENGAVFLCADAYPDDNEEGS